MTPQSLNGIGGTQPEIYRGTVDEMVQALQADSTAFWPKALARDGPIEIWEINGERWFFNGNHRFHAAVQAGVEIPDTHILVVDKTGTAILTWRFDQMTWLSGKK